MPEQRFAGAAMGRFATAASLAATILVAAGMLVASADAADARVRAVSANERRTQFGATVEATTDADGRFALSLGLNQPYRLSVYLESGPRVEHDLIAIDGLDLALQLQPRR